MFVGRTATLPIAATLALLMLLSFAGGGCANMRVPKQQALDEWRSLTATNTPPPRVFVKGDQIRFYFDTATGFEEFSARWGRHRVPSEGYRVNSAVLRWNQKLKRMPVGVRGWREATVIAGAEWNRLSTNLVEMLAPASAGHGVYYQGFLADRLLYRDAQGKARFASMDEEPKVDARSPGDGVPRHRSVIERRHQPGEHSEEGRL